MTMIPLIVGLLIVVSVIAYRQDRLVRRVDRLEDRVRDLERLLVV